MKSFLKTIYLFSIFCMSLVLASNLRTSKQIEKCSKTVCPLVKATICVKVKDHNTPRRYVMMSKCELKLIKCYGDVNTTVVPGKYCNALRQGDISPGKEEDPVNDSSPSEILQGDSPVDQEDPVNDSGPPEILQKQDRLDQEDSVNDSSPVDQEEPGMDSDTPGTSKEEDHVGQEEVAHEPDNDEVPQVEGDNDSDKEKLQSEERLGDDQSGANCPQKCLNRRVMVCARCPHGIYRTFISSCFMRMYQCQHPNEKLELVSRHACTGSAPYMGEMPKPVGESAEPLDVDPVLNHIYHRLGVEK
ncbi:uncharacterized protein LOC133521707 [Cydia pomonella]|uniref:uncharacterized protein LOC133521707 n=1 Tax=Cydia pomonella TaxID=82600 RepID=UPI002ADDBAF7|nr:uncharacterized protein LOC133521707 [Cydia pomonella]